MIARQVSRNEIVSRKILKDAIFLLLLNLVLWLGMGLSACAQLNKSEKAKEQRPASGLQLMSEQDRPAAEPVGLKKGDILVAYPRGENNNRIESASTFIIGQLRKGRILFCNSVPVKLNPDGYFAHTVRLNYGKNQFILKSAPTPDSEKQAESSAGEEALMITIERPSPPAPLSPESFNILPESLQPKEAIGVQSGDLIQFSARATPGCLLSVQFAGHNLPLKAALAKNGKSAVNLGLDTAFGVSYQRRQPALKDLYLAYYKVLPADNFDKVSPVFVLQKGKKLIRAKAKGTITVLKQPQLFKTAHDNCIVRVGPDAARVTPLAQDVRMISDGFKGDWRRFELSSQKHLWIAAADLAADEETALPRSKIKTINLASDKYGAKISIPLEQRLPYQIEQDLNARKLVLRVYGAQADTDYVTSDQLHPQEVSPASKLIDYLSFKEKEDLHYELIVQLLNKEQWGYYANYEGSTLVLHVKSPPQISGGQHKPLEGLTVCVDPGHGGRESGSIGCSGAREARVNFEIADKLRQALQSMGANVVMTRNSDLFVSLADRVERAVKENADLLISVHNNALPDGRDPLAEHGNSSYWYHSQSLELARTVQKNLVKASGLKDYGCRFQNLALCRPSHMLAFLAEIGFMINPDEMSKLLDPAFQELCAGSMAESVKNYMLEKTKASNKINEPAASSSGSN